MTDMSLSQTLIFGHLWQSVAIAAVLAAALIIGKRMRGATRYGLGAAALLASLALPVAAFIPGETIVASLLKQSLVSGRNRSLVSSMTADECPDPTSIT